jgi:hypothetical protein
MLHKVSELTSNYNLNVLKCPSYSIVTTSQCRNDIIADVSEVFVSSFFKIEVFGDLRIVKCCLFHMSPLRIRLVRAL